MGSVELAGSSEAVWPETVFPSLAEVAPFREVVSLTQALTTSPGSVGDGPSLRTSCDWCRQELPATAIAHGQRYCGKRCRQTAWRARRVSLLERADVSLRLAYADPPYPGTSRKYYRDEPTFRGEVDHIDLVSLLQGFDGWALSTSQKALRDVLDLCPRTVRVAPWVKPIGVSGKTRGPHNAHEYLVYVPARLSPPGVRDWLSAMPARGGGDLPGRKPVAFCRWLFSLLGARAGDKLTDLYPGTGVVGRVWRQLSSGAASDEPSPGDDQDPVAELPPRPPSLRTAPTSPMDEGDAGQTIRSHGARRLPGPPRG